MLSKHLDSKMYLKNLLIIVVTVHLTDTTTLYVEDKNYFQVLPFSMPKLSSINITKISQDKNYNYNNYTSNYPSISGYIKHFSTYIDLFGNQRLLIVVDNFGSLNIPPLNYPIILRKQIPISINHINRKGSVSMSKQVWTMEGFGPFNQTNGSLVYCPLSKLFSYTKAPGFFESICVTINLSLYTAQTKPWN